MAHRGDHEATTGADLQTGSAVAPARLVVTGGRAAYPLRDFLTRNLVAFRYLDEDGGDGVPRCVLPDGTELVDPTVSELAAVLGLIRAPRLDAYDLVIIGAGPAGLAAAVYGASEGLTTAVVEAAAPGGQAGTSSRIENYLGFPDGIGGAELADRARRQAERLGAEMLLAREAIRGGDRDGALLVGLSDGSELSAQAVLCSSGVDWRRLDAPGVERLLHAGVYYGAAASEAPGTVGKDVFVVGGGNAAGQAAVSFSGFARTVTLLVRGADAAASMSSYLLDNLHAAANVRILTGVTVTRVDGDSWLRQIAVEDAEGGSSTLDAHALFICVGGEPRTAWAREDGLALDAQGYLLTGADLPRPLRSIGWPLDRDPYPLESNRPGLFVAGDIRHGSTKRVATAVGEGAMVIHLVHRHLQDSRRRRAQPGAPLVNRVVADRGTTPAMPP